MPKKTKFVETDNRTLETMPTSEAIATLTGITATLKLHQHATTPETCSEGIE
jgi:hypothetical protein